MGGIIVRLHVGLVLHHQDLWILVELYVGCRKNATVAADRAIIPFFAPYAPERWDVLVLHQHAPGANMRLSQIRSGS